MDDSNASIQDNSSDINDTQSHIEDLDVDNDASDESETIQAVVEEDTPQKQPHTRKMPHKYTPRQATERPPNNNNAALVASFTQPTQQLHTKLRTAQDVLQQVQQDYQRCSRLSADYRTKHRQQMEMYLTMNKLLYLWHKGSTADSNINAGLIKVMRDNNIMPDEELQALRRANDHVMKEVYNETAQIDKEYFSPNNPMFQDLTEAQQRDVLQNKKMAHQLLKKRLKLMKAMNAPNQADTRYRQAFSNSYFGEKGHLVNTVWGTDDIISSKFDDAFLKSNKVSWYEMKCWSSYKSVVDAQEQKKIAKAVRLAQDFVLQGEPYPIADHIGFLAHLLQADTPLENPTQLTNIHPFLQQQPFLLLKDNEEEETKCSNWLQFANDLFQNELDRMFHKTDAFTVSKAENHIKLQFSDSADNMLVFHQHQKDAPRTFYRVPLVMDENDTRVCLMSEIYNEFEGDLHKQLMVAQATNDMQNLSKQTLGNHYLAIAGTTQHRAEVLVQLVWRACLESGHYYPVIPTLHFVSGLDNEQMTQQELSFWYNEADLTIHIKNTQNELLNPIHDTRHLKGAFREMNEEDDAFQLWREHFSRDARAFVALHDMNNEEFQNQAHHSYSHLVEDLFAKRLSLTVGGVYNETSVQKAIQEYCIRLFLYIIDDTNDDWLDKDKKPTVSEQKDIINANKHNQIYVNENDVWFDSIGALLITLYEQLGKTRANVFAPNVDTLQVEDVFGDIENALDMQMELLEHMVVNGLNSTTPHEIYDKAFFDESKAHDGKIVFCWSTFKNVFGVAQLNVWKRDIDPVCVAKELKQTLHLDIVESNNPVATIDPRVILDCVEIVHDRAYGRSEDKKSGENQVVSYSQVHLLRLMLWNMGVWDVPVNNAGIIKALEQHIDTLIAYGHHPFEEQLTFEDIVYGHASPLLVARLFVLCARFVKFTASEQEQHFTHFKTAYDTIVLNIRHPVFLAMLLKFRGHFIHRPQVHYLYKLWNMVDIGLWKQNMFLWNHLQEYALAVEFISNPKLFQHRDYFQECQLMFDVTKTVSAMRDEDIVQVRHALKDTFVANRIQAPNSNPTPMTDDERKTLVEQKKRRRRREGDAEDEGEVEQ